MPPLNEPAADFDAAATPSPSSPYLSSAAASKVPFTFEAMGGLSVEGCTSKGF